MEARFFAFFQGTWLNRKIAHDCQKYMLSHITDAHLQVTQTPKYALACKRVLISDDYYQALEHSNVQIVTSPIERIEPNGIIVKDGTVIKVDTIIFATGFETRSFLAPMEIEGTEGRTLNNTWREGAHAYLGMVVTGFPNLFMLYCPNTNLGHNSVIFMIECQAQYIVKCVETMARQGLASLDVRSEVMAEHNGMLQHAMRKIVWSGGCRSWYKNEVGQGNKQLARLHRRVLVADATAALT